MSRPRGVGLFRRILFNILSNRSTKGTQMRDDIFGPVQSQLDVQKQLPGSQAIQATYKPVPDSKEPVQVGTDYLGNVYWEMPPDPVHNRRTFKRWYFPQTDDDWDRPVPPEWESWLRYRRPDAPTEEEINRNIAIAQLKKIRAKEIEEKRKLEALSSGDVEGSKEPEQQLDEENKDKVSKSNIGTSIEDQEHRPASDVLIGMYPSRKDLESTPGSSSKARKIDPMYDKRD